jgi:hypothetical protein
MGSAAARTHHQHIMHGEHEAIYDLDLGRDYGLKFIVTMRKMHGCGLLANTGGICGVTIASVR